MKHTVLFTFSRTRLRALRVASQCSLRTSFFGASLLFTFTALAGDAAALTFSTETFKLELGPDARVTSLVVKSTGENLVRPDRTVPFFASFQDRPFHNEVKLIRPVKRTTYAANRIRREGDELIIGFECVPYEAVVAVKTAPSYLAFELRRFIVTPKQYGNQAQDLPPVKEFRLAQLPVLDRENFGAWLGCMWDQKGAVGVIAANPEALIDSEARDGYRVLTATAHADVRLEGTTAVLIAAAGPEKFLDAVDAVEVDYKLPRGVQSRRSGVVRATKYSAAGICPTNADEYIALAKKAGAKRMTIYYPTLVRDGATGREFYMGLGDYKWNDRYPRGEEDVKYVLGKIKAAGIMPGFHVLQTHIGLKSSYVTPVADPRLRLTRHFTLLKDLGTGDCQCGPMGTSVPTIADAGEIEVAENPKRAVMHPMCRYLKFGGELMSYEGYTTEPPYRFTGVKRGAYGTTPTAHRRGDIGGVLDISEFAAHSCYLDQDTDIQDEVAKKIARIYNLGFEYFYFDGSEGVDMPYEYHVANSQYRVWKLCAREPRFAGGAAKSHFGWHMLAGSNGFDVFPDRIMKEKILEWPVEAAKLLAKDFTAVNFGWLPLRPFKSVEEPGTQPDLVEFSISRAVAWDCPDQINGTPALAKKQPRLNDDLEVVRRWEDVREKGWLTPEWREHLRTCKGDHHLYVNEKGEYELYDTTMLPKDPAHPEIRGFTFLRNGKKVTATWNVTNSDPIAYR